MVKFMIGVKFNVSCDNCRCVNRKFFREKFQVLGVYLCEFLHVIGNFIKIKLVDMQDCMSSIFCHG